jgi:hypothetical protein
MRITHAASRPASAHQRQNPTSDRPAASGATIDRVTPDTIFHPRRRRDRQARGRPQRVHPDTTLRAPMRRSSTPQPGRASTGAETMLPRAPLPANDTGFCCTATALKVRLITIPRSPCQQQPGLARRVGILANVRDTKSTWQFDRGVVHHDTWHVAEVRERFII